MNEEQPMTKQPIEPPSEEAQRAEELPPEPRSQDAPRRLRQLLAIPERERTDAIWDEIIALEIELAPGNRAPSSAADAGRRQDPGRRQGRPEQARRQESSSGAKPGKRFVKKPRRGRPGVPTDR